MSKVIINETVDKVNIIDEESLVVITEQIDKVIISDGVVGVGEAPVDGKVYGRKDAAWEEVYDIITPSSTTDNAIVRWDGTDGLKLQDSNIIIDDSDNVTGIGSLSCGNISSNDITAKGTITSDVRLTTDNMFRGYSSSDSFTIDYLGNLTTTGDIEGEQFTVNSTIDEGDNSQHLIFRNPGQTYGFDFQIWDGTQYRSTFELTTSGANFKSRDITTLGDLYVNDATLTGDLSLAGNINFDGTGNIFYNNNAFDAGFGNGHIFTFDNGLSQAILLNLDPNGANFQSYKIYTSGEIEGNDGTFNGDMVISGHISNAAGDSNIYYDQVSLGALGLGHIFTYNLIGVQTTLLDLDGNGADFQALPITTTGNIFANELTLTDDVNAVNGVFSGDVSAVNGTFTGNITNAELQAATTHITSDGTDHSDVVLNNTHRATVIGNPHNVLATQITDFDTEVSNNTDVALNTTHRTSDGSDHGFIDQDVTQSSDPSFAGGLSIGASPVSTHTVNIDGSIQVGNAFNYTPSGTLDFAMGSTTLNSRFLFGESNSLYGGMKWDVASDYLSVGYMGGIETKGLNILTDGKVGIGMIAPTETLDVYGHINVLNNLKFTNNHIAIGTGTASGTHPITIGTSNVTTDYCISIGYANTVAARSIAIGVTAYCNDTCGVAIGYNADVKAGAGNAVAIGRSSDVTGTEGVAIGYNANSSATQYATAVGPSTSVSGPYGTAVGKSSQVTQTSSGAFGYNAKATGGYGCFAIGTSAQALGGSAFAMGYLAKAYGAAVAIGASSYAAQYSIAIGGAANASLTYAMAFGRDSIASGQYSIAIGAGSGSANSANATGTYAIAVGFQSRATTTGTIAIGEKAEASYTDAVAIGTDAVANNFKSTAVGVNAQAGNGGTAYGGEADASLVTASAFGYNATVTGNNGVAIGSGTTAAADGIALGYGASATGSNGAAIGANCSNTIANVLKIGGDVTTTFLDTNLTTSKGRVKNTTRVTTTYTALITDDRIFCDTDGGDFELTLPVGVDGQEFRIINCGSNTLTITPNGAELLTGVNASKTANDGTVIILTYETTEGWW